MTEEYLIAAMRLAAGVDPVPGHVTAAARAAFALRLPGGVSADLVPLGVPPGARTADTAGAGRDPGAGSAPDAPEATGRVYRCSAGGLTIDLEVSVADGRLEVAGQVSPRPGPGTLIEVRTPQGGTVRAPTASGQFAVAGLPPGWVSVVCHRPGRPPVFTRWLRVRA